MNIFKFLIPISLYATMSVGSAQVFSNPVGAVKVDINPGDGTNQRVTAMSVNLHQPIEWSGQVTLNSDTNNPWIQGISNASNDWPTDNSWAGLNEDDRVPNTGTRRIPRFLAFITDNNGAEQAFDIWSVSAGSLNIQYYRTEGQNINIQDIGFPSETTMTVKRVTTISDLFGSGETLKVLPSLTTELEGDVVFMNDGSAWNRFMYFEAGENSGWFKLDGNNFIPDQENALIYNNEAFIILRTQNVSSSITFTGDVPLNNQITDITGSTTNVVGNNFPIGSTLPSIFSTMPEDWVYATTTDNVNDADQVFIYNDTERRYDRFINFEVSGERTWFLLDGSNFVDATETEIPPNSLLLISKTNTDGSSFTSTTPYSL